MNELYPIGDVARRTGLSVSAIRFYADDRDQLISRFWDFVTDGLDVHPEYLERLQARRPHLPEEPSTEQLEAWIELAEIVQDEQFRTALRDHLHRIFGTWQGKLMATPE